MNENDNLTDATLSDAAHVTAADGQAAVAPALTLAELNSTLGKAFKDVPTALKALQETQSWVGKKIDAAAPAPDNTLKTEIDSLKTEVFYASHPELKGHESMLKALGSNPAEAYETEAFKNYLEKAQVADSVTNSKSVVSSNARLSQVKTVMDEAVAITNARGSTNEDSALVFARAINQQNNQG